MEKKQFLTTLRDELIKRDFTPEQAERHVRSLSLTLTPEDIKSISRIDDPAEIGILAQGIAEVKARAAKANAPGDKPAAEADDDVKVYTGSNDTAAEEVDDDSIYESAIAEAEAETVTEEIAPPSPRGRAVFWTVLICTLPLTLVLLAVYFAAFGVGFAALISIIIALFAALIGGVAVGATVSLVGVIYGIVQLITEISAAPGLYEIGLGLSVAGIVMIAGILIYNLAIRLLPWVIRLLGKLFAICTGKLKNLIKSAKEACYKL